MKTIGRFVSCTTSSTTTCTTTAYTTQYNYVNVKMKLLTCTLRPFYTRVSLLYTLCFVAVVSCGPAPLLENSTVTSGGETYGSTATYTCLTGYRPETGSYVKFCDEFGLWNGDSLVCTCVLLFVTSNQKQQQHVA